MKISILIFLVSLFFKCCLIANPEGIKREMALKIIRSLKGVEVKVNDNSQQQWLKYLGTASFLINKPDGPFETDTGVKFRFLDIDKREVYLQEKSFNGSYTIGNKVVFSEACFQEVVSILTTAILKQAKPEKDYINLSLLKFTYSDK